MAEAAYAVSAPRRLNKTIGATVSRQPAWSRSACYPGASPVQQLIRSARPQVKNITFYKLFSARPKRFELLTPRFVVWCFRRAARGWRVTMPQNMLRRAVPELRNLVIKTSGCHAQPIPLIRRAIFFYDLPDRVLPGVVGDLHHAPSPRPSGRRSSRRLSGNYVPTVRDAASCHNSSGFLAGRMPAAIAAAYCGEPTVEAFLKASAANILNHGSKKGGVSCGCETIWIGPSHRRSCRATSPRICDAGTPASALRGVPQARRRLDRVLFLHPDNIIASSAAKSPTSRWAPATKLPAAKTAKADGGPRSMPYSMNGTISAGASRSSRQDRALRHH